VQLLLLSAKTASALETTTDNLASHLRHKEIDLADVAYTTHVGRKPFAYRRVVLCEQRDVEQAATTVGSRDPKRVLTSMSRPGSRTVVFMFPGQGSQHLDMGIDLYRHEKTFRDHVDRCADLLVPYLGVDIREVVYPPADRAEASQQLLNQTELTQPALFVAEYALARLWMEWGVVPQAMIGHSVGEYVAACLAGVFSLEDALELVAARGLLMGSMPSGAMLSVALSGQALEPLLPEDVSIAALNAPSLCVVSGPADAISRVQSRLEDENVACQRLRTSHAFHSAMMDPVVPLFSPHVAAAARQQPHIPFLSNVTGTWITPEEATDPEYWAMHLRKTVRFERGLQEVVGDPDCVLLEIGPGQALSTMARRHPLRAAEQPVIASLGVASADRDSDLGAMLTALGRLWLHGVSIDWAAFHAGERRHRVPLPTYPFERQQYWITAQNAGQTGTAVGTHLDSRHEVADWFYVPSWKRAVPAPLTPDPPSQSSPGRWLILSDSCGIGARLVALLRQQGEAVAVVQKGDRFDQDAEGCYTIDPRTPEDYDALLSALSERGVAPDRILHLWTVTPQDGRVSHEASIDHGFYSVVSLAQALIKRRLEAPVQIAVVSNGVHDVFEGDTVSPAKATVLGPCVVIPQEHSNIECRHIDIALADPADGACDRIANRLVDELRVEPFDAVVAYRGDRRWVRTFEPVHLEAIADLSGRIRDHGVYLVTGGLGNIGLLLAEHLGQAFRARLVLVGRSAFPEPEQWEAWLAEHSASDRVSSRIRRLLALQAAGAEVMVATADVGNSDEMRGVIDRARERFGAIHGVIHAAGHTAEDAICFLDRADRAACERHFQSKIKGLLTIEELLRGTEVDFYFLLSSLSSVLGGLGFTAYSAANAFMDAWANDRSHRDGARRLSVKWDGWSFPEESGLSTSDAASAGLITPEEGLDAARRVLYFWPDGPIAVSPTSLYPRLDRWVNRLGAEEPAEAAQATDVRHERPALLTAYVEPRNDVESSIAALWQQLLGVDAVGIHDNFFELGGHSLLAVQLTSRLSDMFHVEVPVQRLFETPTVAELADGLQKELQPETDDEQRLLTLLNMVEGLSDDEVKKMLAERSFGAGVADE
jgi:acyl transferase domain-containing protein